MEPSTLKVPDVNVSTQGEVSPPVWISTHRWTFSHQSHTRPVMWNQLTTNLGPRDSRKKRVCLGSARLASLLLPWQWPQPERGALEILLVFFVFFPLSLLSLLLPSNLSLRDTPLLFTSLISHTPLASHPLPFISPFPPVNLFNSYSFSMKYHRLILLTPSLLILPPSLPLLFSSSPALSLPVIPDFQIKFEMFLYWHNHNWLQYWWSRSYNIYTRFFFFLFSSALTDYCFPSVLSSSGLIGERSMFATMPNEEICWLKMVDLQPVVVTALCVRVCALVSGFIQKQWNTVCPVLNTDYMNTLKK